MDWLEIFIATSQEGLEIVCGLLYSCGLTGLMIEDKNEFDAFLENPDRDWDYIEEGLVEEKHSKPTGITFFVTDNINGMETLNLVKSSLDRLAETEKEFNLGSLKLTMKNVKEEDWANNWKKYFKPFPIGEKIIIKPSWEEFLEPEGKTILNIDPGHIFGTGTHETTQACIEHIENYVKKGDRILDIGCGSGILSLASLLLGGEYAAAVDIDPNAIKIVTENMEMNDIDKDRFDVYAGDILEDEKFISLFSGKAYDVIEANIVADIIIALCPIIPQFIKDNGIFISSGIISDRFDDVVYALEENGFKVKDVKRKKDWVAICAQYAK